MASWDNPVYEALGCGEQFDRFSISLPDEAATWLTKLVELRGNRPEAPHPNVVGELIADSAEPAVIDAAIARHVAAQHRQTQHGHAEKLCGQRMLAAVMQDRDRLHQELAVVADEIITRLHKAALIDEDIAQLAREKRIDDAALVANVAADVATLKDCYAVRNNYLTPGGIYAQWSTGCWSCEFWQSPWDLPQEVNLNVVSQWDPIREAIRRGGRLWFVPIEEATACSAAHEPREVEAIDPRRSSLML